MDGGCWTRTGQCLTEQSPLRPGAMEPTPVPASIKPVQGLAGTKGPGSAPESGVLDFNSVPPPRGRTTCIHTLCFNSDYSGQGIKLPFSSLGKMSGCHPTRLCGWNTFVPGQELTVGEGSICWFLQLLFSSFSHSEGTVIPTGPDNAPERAENKKQFIWGQS